jgi:ureidoglycolate hydrolase
VTTEAVASELQEAVGSGATMNSVPEHLVEIGASFEQTYKPVLDFHGWKVAMLRHFAVVAAEGFYRVERHWNTNEVFILTAGKADLIILEGDEMPTTPYVFPMQLNVAYNIQQSVWHHVVMSPDAHIILFERSETSVETTDYAELPLEVVVQIKARFTVMDEANKYG